MAAEHVPSSNFSFSVNWNHWMFSVSEDQDVRWLLRSCRCPDVDQTKPKLKHTLKPDVTNASEKSRQSRNPRTAGECFQTELLLYEGWRWWLRALKSAEWRQCPSLYHTCPGFGEDGQQWYVSHKNNINSKRLLTWFLTLLLRKLCCFVPNIARRRWILTELNCGQENFVCLDKIKIHIFRDSNNCCVELISSDRSSLPVLI